MDDKAITAASERFAAAVEAERQAQLSLMDARRAALAAVAELNKELGNA
jgi:hypothetical protein